MSTYLKGGYFQPFWFTEQGTVVQYRPIASSTGQLTYKDRIFQSGSVTNVSDYQWLYNYELDRPSIQNITGLTNNSGVIYQSPSNPYTWTFSGNGTGIITLTCAARTIAKTVVTSTQTNTVLNFSGFATGSAAYNNQTGVNNRISGLSGGTGVQNLYSIRDDANSIYIRNTGCWIKDVDTTCISPWNTQGTFTMAGTLISPCHIIFANHFSLSVGTNIRYVKMDNTVVTKRISATQYVASDISLGILDSDVPSGINFCSVITTGVSGKMPCPATYSESASYKWPTPLIKTNQFKQATIISSLYQDNISYAFIPPTDNTQISFYSPIIGGDSGSPLFYLINGALVLASLTWTYGGGTSLSFYTDAINSGMHSLSVAIGAPSDYQLTAPTLSSFSSY